MSENPNPGARTIPPGNNTLPHSLTTNASSSASTATLGRSAHAGALSTAYTHNLDRFLEQDMCDDGTLHGRVPDHAFHPHSDACVLFYEARAASALAEFDAVFSPARPN